MPGSSRRWRPSSEQVMILQELYRRGLTNPNAAQIKSITAHLAFYGKIQGKNVFYWFQNHKARDRQKLRKKLAKQLHQPRLWQLHQSLGNYQAQDNTHVLHPFHASMPFYLQLLNCHSAQDVRAQGTGVCEKAPGGGMTDLPEDCMMRTCVPEPMMIAHGDPMFPCCNNRPLETLELFPLTSPTGDDQKTTC